jgi:hypothetical protein
MRRGDDDEPVATQQCFRMMLALMMMPFNCSYRNKNEPSAIYPSFGYSPPLRVRESVLFIGTQFSILYTSMYSPLLNTYNTSDLCRAWARQGDQSHCALVLTRNGTDTEFPRL